MTNEEKQQLLKDLCARVPYGVKFTLSGDNIYTMKGIDLIVTDEGDWEYAVTAKGIEPIEIEYIKPYLRPMSSMTEEEWLKLKEWIFVSSDTKGKIYFGGFRNISAEDTVKAIDYLNSHHFDYRGLIPMGLALEAPEGMYKEK